MSASPFGSSKGGDGPRRPAVVPFHADDRLPPQNVEVEKSVLGALLLDNDALHEVMPLLRPEDFYRDSHQTIFRAIRTLYDQGKPVDLLILTEELKREGDFEKVGGLDALTEIANSAPHAANAKYHAHIVREKAIAREVMHSPTHTLETVYANPHTADQLLDQSEAAVAEIRGRRRLADAEAPGLLTTAEF